MEALTFRKMICSAGHESRPFAEGEMLPRRCPVCNQPYDRKYTRPILCYSDGSTPPGDSETAGKEEEKETAAPEAPAEKREENPGAFQTDDQVPPSSSSAVFPRRGRVITPSQSSIPQGIRRGRTLDTGFNSRKETGQEVPVRRQTAEPQRSAEVSTGIALYHSGYQIPIPEEGCILGREGCAGEYLAVNAQISRKHAYIKADRLGKIYIRDEDSLNGTYLDDGNGRKKLIPNQTVEAKIGDTVWLANQVFIIGKKS